MVDDSGGGHALATFIAVGALAQWVRTQERLARLLPRTTVATCGRATSLGFALTLIHLTVVIAEPVTRNNQRLTARSTTRPR